MPNGVHTKTGGDSTFLLGVVTVNNKSPKEFTLYQNYPNPFNPNTVIKFSTPLGAKDAAGNPPERGTYVRLIVYDILGREVATLVNEELKPGTYEEQFDGTNLASGIYLYRVEAHAPSGDNFIETKRMVMIK